MYYGKIKLIFYDCLNFNYFRQRIFAFIVYNNYFFPKIFVSYCYLKTNKLRYKKFLLIDNNLNGILSNACHVNHNAVFLLG